MTKNCLSKEGKYFNKVRSKLVYSGLYSGSGPTAVLAEGLHNVAPSWSPLKTFVIILVRRGDLKPM